MRSSLGPVAVFAFLILGTLASAGSYRLSAEDSLLEVHVPKAGLFSFAGHEHTVVADRFDGWLVWDPAEPQAARLEVTVAVKDLVVTDEGLSIKNRQKVRDTMVSAKVLKMATAPQITFVSKEILVTSPNQWSVHGVIKVGGTAVEISFEARVRSVEGDRLHASGYVPLPLKSFGIEPVGALGGTVRTGDTVEVRFEILTQAAS